MGKKESNKTKIEVLEEMQLKEQEPTYSTIKEKKVINPSDYVTLEEFRAEAKKRARKLLKDYGVH